LLGSVFGAPCHPSLRSHGALRIYEPRSGKKIVAAGHNLAALQTRRAPLVSTFLVGL